MPSTFTLISARTLTSSVTSVSLNSIPSTFTDLVIKGSIRTDFNTNNTGLRVTFNGDTATNYSGTAINAAGTTVQSERRTSQSRTEFYTENGSTDIANNFSNFEIYIPSYRLTQNKPMGGYGLAETNTTTGNYMGVTANLWRNTAAITSITFTSVFNYLAGSSFYLYGVSNS
jgi:hypothetical protein